MCIEALVYTNDDNCEADCDADLLWLIRMLIRMARNILIIKISDNDYFVCKVSPPL